MHGLICLQIKLNLSMRYFFVIIFGMCLYSFAEGAVYPKYQAGIGYSMLSGAGINYLHEFNPDYVFKISGFMYYEGESEPNRDIFANLGAEMQRNFYKTKNKRLYLLAGASWWNLHKKSYSTFVKNDITYEIKSSDFNRIYNIGLGSGYEYRWRKFSFSADGGVLFKSSYNNKFRGLFNLSENNRTISPFLSVSLRYIIK
jgi:hypothetical protein